MLLFKGTLFWKTSEVGDCFKDVTSIPDISYFISMLKTVFALFLVFCSPILYAQNKANDGIPALKPIACDCKKAVNISIDWNTVYGPTIDTKGFGDIQEIPIHDKYSKYYFETEHNSAWYLIKPLHDGELVFDIIPENPSDDYDFLLFKYTDTNFCRDFIARKLIPVRSNISRVSSDDSGRTGLAYTAKIEYETRGKGFAYSKSIPVKKGEHYMLILDNVYDGGKGHTIIFHILKNYHLSGKTLNDDSTPVSATISVLGKNGTVVTKTESDETTGNYNFTTPLQIGGHYTITYYTPHSFFDIKGFTPTTKIKDTVKYKPVVLPTLKENKTYKLKNILFYPDSDEVLPQSLPTLKMLSAILTIHTKMTIRIEGHVNPIGDGKTHYEMDLSERRATTVYNYLVKNGIKKERLSTIGFGGKYPLFICNEIFFKPYPPEYYKQEEKAQQNRRVEIRIISMGE